MIQASTDSPSPVGIIASIVGSSGSIDLPSLLPFYGMQNSIQLPRYARLCPVSSLAL